MSREAVSLWMSPSSSLLPTLLVHRSTWVCSRLLGTQRALHRLAWPTDKAGAPVSEAGGVCQLRVPSPERGGQAVLGLGTAVPVAREEALLAASSHHSFKAF